MKKLSLIVCMISIVLSIFTACQSSPLKNPDHSKQEESDMTGFFSPTPSSKKLLNRDNFFELIKQSSKTISYGEKYHMIYLKDLIKIVGKPQRESPFLDSITSGIGITHPRCKCFEWDLKDDMVISYNVELSPKCPYEEANFDNILEYGIVYDLFKLPPNIIELPEIPEPSAEEKNFFDLNKEHITSSGKIQQIQRGMTFSEVVNTIGKPHGFGTERTMSFKWFTEDNDVYNIKFYLNDDFVLGTPENLDAYCKYGVVMSSPQKSEIIE